MILVLLVSILVFSTVASVVIASAYTPLEKRIFLRYKKGFAKPPGVGKPPKDDNDDAGYYTLLGKGVKWKTIPVSYVIDPENPNGLKEAFITGAIFDSAEQWDSHTTTTEIFNNVYGIVDDATVDLDAPDGSNEVLFGRVEELFEDDSLVNVIAVTIVWGIWGGPPGRREIVEFDIMFDTDYSWGNADDGSEVMDLQNIATHEFGHGVGLGDLYEDAAFQETMYGYASYGEIIKRTLYYGDSAGIMNLYG